MRKSVILVIWGMKDLAWLVFTLLLKVFVFSNWFIYWSRLYFKNISIFIPLKVLVGNFSINRSNLNGLMDAAIVIFKSMTLMNIFELIIPLVSLVFSAFSVYPFMNLVYSAIFIITLSSLVILIVFLPKSLFHWSCTWSILSCVNMPSLWFCWLYFFLTFIKLRAFYRRRCGNFYSYWINRLDLRFDNIMIMLIRRCKLRCYILSKQKFDVWVFWVLTVQSLGENSIASGKWEKETNSD
jgi:hypothetical protein